MKVCIAEKPSVAKEIAEILGAKTRKDGYFEGGGYRVTWTYGHFCQLKEPQDYNESLKKWNIRTLPIFPQEFGIKLINNEGAVKQFGIIKKLLENAKEVINCGDAGQEGELIQRWVLEMAGYNKPFKRLWISSLTEEAIKEGFENLKESKLFDKLFEAGKSRAVGDWLLGINATRLYTLKFAPQGQVFSIGRVQTPTLAMIVERHLEIQNFKPEHYWLLKTVYKNAVFNYTKGKFTDEEKAVKIFDSIKDHEIKITSVITKKGKEKPPKLFDLTSLQVEINKRYGIGAEKSLNIIQGLYEKKIVTYPRVDTQYLSEDIYPKIPSILKGLTSYKDFTTDLLKSKIRKSPDVFNDKKVTDHHAIIPTGKEAKGLSEVEFKIFDLITRRFLSAFYPDCIVSNTTVKAEINKSGFTAKGKQILEQGWRVLYSKEPVEDTKEKEEDQVLPSFAEGETGDHAPKLEKKMTTPPKPFTEGTLLRAMETAGKNIDDDELRDLLKENGIGRPSTRAAIIETLFKRNYINKEKKNIIPTDIGIRLIGLIKNPILKSAELTGQWEKKLRQIEKGEYLGEVFIKEMKEMVNDLTNEITSANKTQNNPIIPHPEKKIISLGKCPKCKTGLVITGNKAYGCNRWKEGCNFRVNFEISDFKIPREQVVKLITSGKTDILEGFFSKDRGKNFNASLKLNPEFEVEFVF